MYLDIEDSLGLVKVLAKHKSLEIRQKAIELLFDAPYHYRIPHYLVRTLEDSDEYVRINSAALLFIYSDRRGFDILVKNFHNLSDDIRLKVIKWVPEQEDENGLRVLIDQALDDKNQEVRDLAKEYLQYIEE